MKRVLSIILSVVIAMPVFTSCATADKALASTYLNLGEKYLTDLDYEEAIVYFNKLIEVDPKNERAYLGMAEAYIALGDTDSAIAILEQGIVIVDDTTELRAMLGEDDEADKPVTSAVTTSAEVTTATTTTVTTQATTVTTTVATTTIVATTEAITTTAFSVESLSATMYATDTLNVRSGPSTEYDRIGRYSKGDEVTVTGKVSNGWYQVDYNGREGYVSGNYLSFEKVEVTTVATTTTKVETTVAEEKDTFKYVPSGAGEYNGHYYYVYNVSSVTSWDDAVAYCESLNGYLATITSEEENSFLYNYMVLCGYKSAYFGFTDSEKEGTWKWVNGESVTYTNWHKNEPNSESSSEDYAMFYYKYSDGTWNDGDFNGSTVNGGKVFICEWGN